MTNESIILAEVLVLVLGSIAVAADILHTKIKAESARLETVLRARLEDLHNFTDRAYTDTVEHVSATSAAIETSLAMRVSSHAERVVNFLATHADDLEKHAREIKQHSIEAHDRAISREIAPREAVKRT